jgi:hypothetical protein
VYHLVSNHKNSYCKVKTDWINLVRLINYEKLRLEKKGSDQQLRMGNLRIVVTSKTAADIPLRKILFKPSKTYTDICRNWNDGGVVAKPGIATGSRS